jgi:hypothetical protein
MLDQNMEQDIVNTVMDMDMDMDTAKVIEGEVHGEVSQAGMGSGKRTTPGSSLLIKARGRRDI